ncbi:immunity protein Imm33 domain-containing protein [Archangium sp.]|uniref:immunity protein Imm33 domain-containing protein n=1 Tax=Archangium sp. TaxID=1872627 RepID=UPI003BB926B6
MEATAPDPRSQPAAHGRPEPLRLCVGIPLVAHLADWCPLALKFLGLPPGWRFLVAEGHEDVWEDPTLLDT